MPLPSQMGVNISPADVTTIQNALNTALRTLNGIQVVQLTVEERGKMQSMSETRFPYTQKAIETLAPQFPNLQPPFMPLADAQADLETSLTLREINVLVKEINDRFTDFALASERYAYLYMRKFYAIAKEGQAVNTPGADTVVSELSPLFEGMGPQADEEEDENPNP
jgi:hypothetical protein